MTPDTAHICSKGTRLFPTVSRSVPVLLTPEHLASQVFVLIVVQSLSRVQLSATSWTAAHQASMSFAISQSLLKFMSIESIHVHDAIQPSHPPSPSSPPALNLSQHQGLFQHVSSSHQVAKLLEL